MPNVEVFRKVISSNIFFQNKIVEEFFMHKKAKVNIEFDSVLNETQENIVHLLLNYSPYVAPKFLLKRNDLTKELLNAIGNEYKN